MTRRLHPLPLLLGAILAMLPLAPAAHAQPASPIAVQAALPQGPITPVDRVQIPLTITVAPGLALDPWQGRARADLETAGWTVVSIAADAPRLGEQGRIAHHAVITIEPFLPGDYTIPPLTFTASGAAGAAAESASAAGTIAVESLLPQDDQDQLPLAAAANTQPPPPEGIGSAEQSPPAATDQPATDQPAAAQLADAPLGELRPLPPEGRPSAFYFVLAMVAAMITVCVAAIAVIVNARRAGSGDGPDPLRELRALARNSASSRSDLDAADRLFRASARRHLRINPVSPDAFRADLLRRGLSGDLAGRASSLLAALERARYAPRPDDQAAGLIADAAHLAEELRSAAPAPPPSAASPQTPATPATAPRRGATA